jgi:DNA-binding transcriptional ArsR family regulator
MHHLKKLDLIKAKSDDGYTRFFVTQTISRDHKKVLSVIRQKIKLHIILYLSFYHVSTRKELSLDLDKSISTVSFHLKKLIKMGIVEKILENNEIKYKLKDEKATDKILYQYKKSYVDEESSFFFEYVDRIYADRWVYKFIYLIGTDRSFDLEEFIFDILPHPYHV